MSELVVLNDMKGVEPRPDHCKNICKQFTIGTGFVHDRSPKAPRIAVMVPAPTKDDCLHRAPLAGKARAHFERTYLEPLGYSPDDYMVSSVLRCLPKGDGSASARHGDYPTGTVRKGAEAACRYYDRNGPLERFDPDSYVLTLDLARTYKEPAYIRLVRRDIEKAFTLADRGYRPLVLMGNPAAELICPFLVGNGGVKAWRGHWDELPEGWPSLSGREAVPARRFAEASYDRGSKRKAA